MNDDNPTLIQEPGHAASAAAAPLVLIHDGGGTVFGYHCLGSLGGSRRDRAVWAIANPRYATRVPWAGGIPAMARHYAGMVRLRLLPNGGDVILGGWSLGGLLALAVAHVLAADNADDADSKDKDANGNGSSSARRIRVLGVVMVDSACPSATMAAMASARMPILPHVLQWNEYTRPQTREAVTWCFDQAGKMMRRWRVPRWADDRYAGGAAMKDGLEAGGRDVKDGADDGVAPVEDGEGKEEAGKGEEEEKEEDGMKKTLTKPLPGPPPPVFLIRASQPVRVADTVSGSGVSRVDVMRGDKLLGWRHYRDDFIKRAVDVPGDHFSIFTEDEGLDAVTMELGRACREIEQLARHQ